MFDKEDEGYRIYRAHKALQNWALFLKGSKDCDAEDGMRLEGLVRELPKFTKAVLVEMYLSPRRSDVAHASAMRMDRNEYRWRAYFAKLMVGQALHTANALTPYAKNRQKMLGLATMWQDGKRPAVHEGVEEEYDDG